MPNPYEHTRRPGKDQVVARTILVFFLIGLAFPLFGTWVDGLSHGLSFVESFSLQTQEPLLWIIDTAPLVFGFLGAMIGMGQARLDALNQQAQDRVFHYMRAQDAIIQEANYVIITTDPDGTVAVFNTKAEKLLGMSAESVIGKRKFQSFLVEAEIHSLSQKMGIPWNSGSFLKELRTLVALSSGLEESPEAFLSLVDQQGRQIPVRLSVSMLREKNGEPASYVLIAKDLTELKAAERKLEENERRLQQFLNALPLAIYIVNHEGVPIYSNQISVEMLGAGVQKDANLLRTSGDLGVYLAGTQTEILGENLPIVRALRGEYCFVDNLEIARKGIRRRLEVWASPVRGAQGKIEYAIAAFADVTEKFRLQGDMVRLASVVEQSRDAIVSLNLAGIVQSWNQGAEKILDYSFVEAKGLGFSIFVTPQSQSAYSEALKIVVELGESSSFEGELKGKSGETEPVAISLTPLRDPRGGQTGVSLVARSIRERKKAEGLIQAYLLDLEKSNQELDQFAYVVSHDLKAPLRAINQLAEWIEEDLGPEATPPVVNHLQMLKKRAIRLQELVVGILEYSRIGRRKPEAHPVNIQSLVREVLDVLALPPGIQVHNRLGQATLSGEKNRLFQVFSNLIGNAAKYQRKETGNIWLDSRQENGGWIFSVKDDGPGIPAQFHEKVFGVFQRLESRDEIEGTGIGLSIVKKIVEDAGGKVWVESEQGQGATFYFSWPLEL